ncbi:MAG TPA: hypothetical protein VML75_10000 [Kofleriaceae bacterium]|nr:hypothetical protein [Kofleriaceae bacterium]
MRGVGVWVVMVVTACGGEKKNPGGQPPAEATSAPSPGQTPAAAAAAPTGDAVAPAGPRELTQLDPVKAVALGTILEYEVLGWTADGRAVALLAKYNGAVDGPRPLLSFRIVIDAYTNEMVELFRHENKMKFDPDDPPMYTDSWTKKDWEAALEEQRHAWKVARSSDEWKAWIAAHPLVMSEPSVTSPDGQWTLEATLTTTAPKKPDNWKLTTKNGRGFYYTWDQKVEYASMALNEGGQTEKDLMKTSLYKEAAFDIYLRRGTERHYNSVWFLDYDLFEALEKGDLGPVPELVLRGNVRAFWSPKGDRIFWATYDGVGPDRGEASHGFAAVGPWIGVFDRGAGTAKALAAVAAIEHAGHPVAQIWTQSAERVAKVTYKGDYAELARTVAAAVGNLPVEPSDKGAPGVMVWLGKP